MKSPKSLVADNKLNCEAMRASAKHALGSNAPTTTLADALSALCQVKICTASELRRVSAAAMMKRTVEDSMENPEAKHRRIDDSKEGTMCFGCGKEGHWFNDRKECLYEMNDR